MAEHEGDRKAARGRQGLPPSPAGARDEDLSEALSALVDGELAAPGRERVLRALMEDPELRRRWLHYHLISDALRRNLPERLDPAFGRRMAVSLAGEPPPQAQVGPQAAPAPRRWAWGAGLALAASVAAVAVLGVLRDSAVPPGMGGGGPQVAARGGVPGKAPAVASRSEGSSSALASGGKGGAGGTASASGPAPAASVPGLDEQALRGILAAGASGPGLAAALGPQGGGASRGASLGHGAALGGGRGRLYEYLVNHDEFGTPGGPRGMVPYVRIVGFEGNAGEGAGRDAGPGR